ncbi:MAG: TetR/AcrR family transcriptional regulator [Variovorax sp.]|nr:MAG: TetR/AcrR family transcriptional regulator [Variovorax sp.]
MPRVRSDDYDAKSLSIMDSAAALFAKVGYPNAKMQDIAQACGATKSMLYHYFPTKDDLLSAMLTEHLEKVIASVEEAVSGGAPVNDRFAAFVQTYAQKSAQSRRRHVIAMNDVKFLPKAMQTPLRQLERTVTQQVAGLLREVNPGLQDHVYKPYAMMLLGMLNWTDYWYRPGGPMKSDELCDRITRLFLLGFMAEKK